MSDPIRYATVKPCAVESCVKGRIERSGPMGPGFYGCNFCNGVGWTIVDVIEPGYQLVPDAVVTAARMIVSVGVDGLVSNSFISALYALDLALVTMDTP